MALAYPEAQAILPQFGSCPKMADLTKEEDTTALATFFAASLSVAPVAFTSIKQVAPSPSQAIDFARPCMIMQLFGAKNLRFGLNSPYLSRRSELWPQCIRGQSQDRSQATATLPEGEQ